MVGEERTSGALRVIYFEANCGLTAYKNEFIEFIQFGMKTKNLPDLYKFDFFFHLSIVNSKTLK